MVDLDWEPLSDRPWLRGEHAQTGIDPLAGCMQGGIEDDIAAADAVLADLRPAQHQGAALPGFTLFDGLVLGIDRAHARFKPRGADDEAILEATQAGQYRTGDGRTEALQGEGAVDGKAKQPLLRPARGRGGGKVQLPRQFRQPGAGEGRHRQDWRAGETGTGNDGLDLARDSGDLVVANQIAFVDGDQAAFEPQ